MLAGDKRQSIWTRFNNPLGRVGFIVVFLITLLSLFAPILAPDKDPRANTIDMAIARQSPGFVVERFWKRTENTSNAPVSIDSAWLNGDSLLYFPFGWKQDRELQQNSIHVNSIESQGVEGIKNYITSNRFWLGTDRFGRDMLSRMLRGSRVSLSVGFMAVLIALLIGLTLGLLAGYYRGRVDAVIGYLIDVIWSLPTLLVVIAITLALGKGFWQIFIAVGLTMWVDVARMVRGQVLSLREKEFIEASRALGQKPWRIMVFHMLPHLWGPLLVLCAANFAGAILLEAGLSFLGLGVQAPEPSWGMMIKEHYSYVVMGGAYLALIPGLAIMILVLAFNWLANGLRDALDVSGR